MPTVNRKRKYKEAHQRCSPVRIVEAVSYVSESCRLLKDAAARFGGTVTSMTESGNVEAYKHLARMLAGWNDQLLARSHELSGQIKHLHGELVKVCNGQSKTTARKSHVPPVKGKRNATRRGEPGGHAVPTSERIP